MAESQNSTAFREFSREESVLIENFLDEALEELERQPSAEAIHRVLEKLTSDVSRDFSLVLGERAGITTFVDEARREIVLPAEPSKKDLFMISMGLDMYGGNGEGTDLFDPIVQSETVAFLPMIIESIGERYGIQNVDVLERLRKNFEDCGVMFKVGGKMLSREQAEASYRSDPATLNKKFALAMEPLVGTNVSERLRKHASKPPEKNPWSLERMLDACMRLFLRSEDARNSFLTLLQNSRLTLQARLAQGIAKKGYATLSETNEVSEYDLQVQVQEVLRESTKIYSDLHARDVNMEHVSSSMLLRQMPFHSEFLLDPFLIPDSSADDPQPGEVHPVEPKADDIFSHRLRMTVIPDARDYFPDPFPIPDPDAFLDYLNDHDFKLWHETKEYLDAHERQIPKKILDSLNPEECCEKLNRLGHLNLWNALAAEECVVLSKIYAAVKLLPYGFDSSDRDEMEKQSTVCGTPRYVAEHGRVNCFSGPWLIAALAVKCGIPYERIFYCDINFHCNERFGAHGKLLFHLRNGTCVILDPADSDYLQRFPMKLIQDRREFIDIHNLLQHRVQEACESQQKFIGDPVHLHIDPAIANSAGVASDFRVIAPDQAFSARALLNVGICFEREGKEDEAMHAYEMGLVLEPTNPDLLCRLGELALRKKELYRADRYLVEALKANTGHMHAAFAEALLCIEIGDYDAATKALNELSKDTRKVWADPNFQTRVQSALALLGLRMGLAVEVSELVGEDADIVF